MSELDKIPNFRLYASSLKANDKMLLKVEINDFRIFISYKNSKQLDFE